MPRSDGETKPVRVTKLLAAQPMHFSIREP